ncbi:MAG: class I SAM-dependent methyltransferase [Polyangiaceae bacterium]|nr:class I SAM-dependent methyltransferase [Polyangiaceae bacterium]
MSAEATQDAGAHGAARIAGIPPALLEALWPRWRPSRVLFEDEDLLVVDKPAGIATHAQELDRIDDAWSRVRESLRERGDAAAYLGIHQRLDRDTSGVLLFTRRREANPSIARQFEGRSVEKTYVAAVAWTGDRPARGTLRHRIAPGEGGAMRAFPTTGPGARGPGPDAVTHYRLLDRRGDRALLELRPETGRTHQIRVQLAAAGVSVAGDRLYSGPAAERLLLHAAALSIAHPATGAPVTFRAPFPHHFGEWLDPARAAPFASAGAVERALRDAADLRYGIARSGGTTALRLAHGGGDGLPGLSVDLYGEHLVVALFGPDAERARDIVLDAAHRLGARGVYLKIRPKHASVIVDPKQDAYAPCGPVRGEPAPDAFTILENGLPYEVRLGEGLSTGIFLDQRENRRRVQALAGSIPGGARVLNLFAYAGAFTVAAAAGGARATVSVDVSRGALAWARRNLDGVGADPAAHALVEADVIPWLKAAARGADRGSGRRARHVERDPEPRTSSRFDLVVLDPPSFATTKTSRFSAESDYADLAALALRLLAPGGRLLACTNSRKISRGKLRRRLRDAAREAGCDVAQMKDLPDPPDFPPEPGDEPHLKSVLVTLADAPRPPDRSADLGPRGDLRTRGRR